MYAAPLSVGNSDICVKTVTGSKVIQYALHAYYDCGVGSGQKVNWSIFPEQKTVGLISERLLVPMSVFHLSPYCYLDSSTTIRIRLIKHNAVFLAANAAPRHQQIIILRYVHFQFRGMADVSVVDARAP